MSLLMEKHIYHKQGGDMLQTLLILVILGALVVTISVYISKQFTKSGEQVVGGITNDSINVIQKALSPEEDTSGENSTN